MTVAGSVHCSKLARLGLGDSADARRLDIPGQRHLAPGIDLASRDTGLLRELRLGIPIEITQLLLLA